VRLESKNSNRTSLSPRVRKTCGENAQGKKYSELAVEAALTESIKQLLAMRLVKK
jgi:hypothetical protein